MHTAKKATTGTWIAAMGQSGRRRSCSITTMTAIKVGTTIRQSRLAATIKFNQRSPIKA